MGVILGFVGLYAYSCAPDKSGELLRQDMAHLDTIQTTTASAREFAIAHALERQSNENTEALLSRMAKDIRDRGFHVQIAMGQDIQRLLAVYYQQDVTTEFFEQYDGEMAMGGMR